MMVLQSSLETLPMTCRGGYHCCARNDDYHILLLLYYYYYRNDVKLCVQDEGDCNTDQDCAGSLVCGDNNCPQSVRGIKIIFISRHHDQLFQGGLWDPDDDCCTTKCTSSNPCSSKTLMITLYNLILSRYAW